VRIDDVSVSVRNPHVSCSDEMLMTRQPLLLDDDDRLRVRNDQLLDEDDQVIASRGSDSGRGSSAVRRG
jgi:hypothetical protein